MFQPTKIRMVPILADGYNMHIMYGMPTNLKALGVEESSLEKLALDCSRNKTRILSGDMSLAYENILDIYKMAYNA